MWSAPMRAPTGRLPSRRSPPPRRPSRRGSGARRSSASTCWTRPATRSSARQELGELLAREEGKPLADGVGEAGRAGQIFKFFAGEALRLAGERVPSVRPGVEVDIYREPLGVVGLITPWNFPLAIPRLEDRAGARLRQHGGAQAGRPGARLAPGRSPTSCSGTACPEGVFNLVMGRGSVVGEAILDSPDVAAVSFTGRSIPAGTSRRSAPRAWPSSSSRWAARTRSWCSTTPISTSR